ncbi:MAG: glycosyl transferase family 1 [Actinobacteria bacterium 13_2_20CM_2_71_6]|nr:MAG: glycosyl transferase family 1 [Actinobacteria bacterium 13_2_20CM_2_71_6]
MRVAIITESFPPDINGVAHSVVRVAEHLVARGHLPLVIAPEPASGTARVAGKLPYPVVRVPSVPMPGYPSFRLGLPSRRLPEALLAHGTDLVHLASPFFLGARGSAVSQRLQIPHVAVYQTDIPAYASAYKMRGIGEAAAWRWLRGIHNAADRTLAPSTASATALHAHGIERVWLWRRGVDTVRFDPRHRSAAVRRALAPNNEILIGYVGRLAVEKRVDLLAPIAKLPGARLVIIGGGPAEPMLRKALPGAVFLGSRQGSQLTRLYASLDVFVHSGPYETFGQTLQEAAASGVPVVAPAAGGPMDLVAHGETGYLVPPLSAGALADAAATLAGSADLRRAFGTAARAMVLSRSWSAVGDQLIDHYRAVLGAVHPAAVPAVAA